MQHFVPFVSSLGQIVLAAIMAFANPSTANRARMGSSTSEISNVVAAAIQQLGGLEDRYVKLYDEVKPTCLPVHPLSSSDASSDASATSPVVPSEPLSALLVADLASM